MAGQTRSTVAGGAPSDSSAGDLVAQHQLGTTDQASSRFGEASVYVVVVILVLGFAIRLSAARNLSPHVDEAASILAARMTADRGAPILPSGVLYLQGATISYLLTPFVWLGFANPIHLTLLRLPSVLAGTAALYFMFLLGRDLSGRVGWGIVSALFLMLDPASIRWDGLTRMYGLLQCLSLALVWLFLRILPRRADSQLIGAFIAVFWLGVFTHIAVCLLLPPMAIAALLYWGRALRHERRDLVLALVACAVAPVTLLALNRLGPPPGEPVGDSIPHFSFVGDQLLSIRQILDPNFAPWSLLFRGMPLPVVMQVLIVGATGFLLIHRFRQADVSPKWSSKPFCLAATLALLYWLPIFLVAATTTASQERYLLHVHPIGLLLIVLAIADLAGFVPALDQHAPAPSGILSPAPALAGPAITGGDQLSLSPAASPALTSGTRELALSEPSRRATALTKVRTNHVAIAGIAVAVILGAGLRVVHLTHLSLWLDEGFTALYARRSWRDVLGFDGFYSPHPPLYFAMVKAVSAAVSEALAGRLTSVVAGIAAIPIVAALAWRLLGRRPAVVAALVFALSPLHFYYSQEARMYTLVLLLVALSYLALVSFEAAPSWGWAAVYGVAVTAALYADYSAAFALAPQVIVIAMVLDRRRRAALPLIVACAGAVIAYLPWATQVIASVRGVNDLAKRDASLGVNPARVPTALLSIVGLAGDGSYFQSTHAMPWNAWPGLRVLMLLAFLPVVALGVAALVRRPFAGVVTACLFGTVAVTMWISLISPSFAERTILSATLGWALLIGAAFADRQDRLRTMAAAVSLSCSLALMLVSLQVVDAHASKQRWQEAAADVALASSLPIPLVTYSYADVATTLIDIYQTGTLDGMRVVAIQDGELEPVLGNGHFSPKGLTRADVLAGKLAEILPPADPANGLLWYVSYPRSSDQEIADQIEQLGYQRILHRVYPDPRYLVSLDLYAQPGVHVGSEREGIGVFATGNGWTFAPDITSIVPGPGSESRLAIESETFAPDAATFRLPIAGASLVEFTFQMKTALAPNEVGIALTCLSDSDEALAQNREFFTSIEADTQGWKTVRLAELCPQDSATAQFVLSTYAAGAVELRTFQGFSQPIDKLRKE